MIHYQVQMWQFEAKYYTLSSPYVVAKYDTLSSPYVVVRGQI